MASCTLHVHSKARHESNPQSQENLCFRVFRGGTGMSMLFSAWVCFCVFLQTTKRAPLKVGPPAPSRPPENNGGFQLFGKNGYSQKRTQMMSLCFSGAHFTLGLRETKRNTTILGVPFLTHTHVGEPPKCVVFFWRPAKANPPAKTKQTKQLKKKVSP